MAALKAATSADTKLFRMSLRSNVASCQWELFLGMGEKFGRLGWIDLAG
jgi:hypothetical protein